MPEGAGGELERGGALAVAPGALLLCCPIARDVPRKAEDEAQHVVRNRVVEDAPHVGHDDRMGDQLGKEVALQAGQRSLNPAQLARCVQHLRGNLTIERLGSGDLAHGNVGVARHRNVRLRCDLLQLRRP